jgi:hypothetical protein
LPQVLFRRFLPLPTSFSMFPIFPTSSGSPAVQFFKAILSGEQLMCYCISCYISYCVSFLLQVLRLCLHNATNYRKILCTLKFLVEC